MVPKLVQFRLKPCATYLTHVIFSTGPITIKYYNIMYTADYKYQKINIFFNYNIFLYSLSNKYYIDFSSTTPIPICE